MIGQRTRDHSTIPFYGLWVFIVSVSVIDGYLVVRHRHQIPEIELNPIGRILVDWNSGRVWYLLIAKYVGTILACASLLVIRHFSSCRGLVVASAIAALQFLLLLFLLLT